MYIYTKKHKNTTKYTDRWGNKQIDIQKIVKFEAAL